MKPNHGFGMIGLLRRNNMLVIGQKAPDFTLQNEAGDLVSLSDFKDQTCVLYFYPKDDTPGCTTQACFYRDSSHEFVKRGVKVIGISKDDVKSHKKFQEKFQLNFTILADPDTTVVQRYDVWKEKSMYGKKYMGVARTTFVIEKGIIKAIFENVDPKNDVEMVLNFLDQQ
jgi:thioredoxin-dependent peroxiredoxin